MHNKKDLNRFHKAQQQKNGHYTGHDIAYSELQAGKKTSHWIWYIFPQLESLGFSQTAIFYGIVDFNEACDYLRDPLLFKNYNSMITVVQTKLDEKILIGTLMGGDVDAKKLASSLTLFRAAASYLASLNESSAQEFKALEHRCNNILDIISKQNYKPCTKTLTNDTVVKAFALETPVATIVSTPTQNHESIIKSTPGPTLISTPIPAPPHITVPIQENTPKNMIRITIIELDRYISQRDQEPSYWFQGLFKGFNKREKLSAVISLRLKLEETVDEHSELARIIKKNGLDFEKLRQQETHQDFPILRQGRLGEALRKIANTDNIGDWHTLLPGKKQGVHQHRTVRELIKYLLNHCTAHVTTPGQSPLSAPLKIT